MINDGSLQLDLQTTRRVVPFGPKPSTTLDTKFCSEDDSFIHSIIIIHTYVEEGSFNHRLISLYQGYGANIADYHIIGNLHERKHSRFSHFAGHLQTFSSSYFSFPMKTD